jgi:hypothetical protein
MTSRIVNVSVMALLCLSVAAIASAQRWGHERVPDAGACFYKDINFRGEYFCVRSGEDLRSMARGMNDQISSIRTFGGAHVTVFRDSNMRGASARFAGDVPDLRREHWNDLISSVVVERGELRDNRDRREPEVERGPVWGHEATPRAGACFYHDPGFRGEYFCIARGSSYALLPAGFNDSIRSIRVFGAGVQIFLNRDFRGRAGNVRRDVPDLRGMWRDNISSVRVF